MRDEIKKHLFDISEAISDIEDFVADKEYVDYEESSLLQAAIERKFEIIGEALIRIRNIDSEFIENITDYRRIIGFRNVIAHGYDIIENNMVWSAIKNHVPKLKDDVKKLAHVGFKMEH
ncbi:MAG: DUF86 domain-containing protein [Desulfobacterales bacterium]|nr:DUF86 domain-containing protein [Desulfobacterales bacterium]MBF0395258.1 DUF86 domain-containing protein [Desulfobacterales bacterium]